MGQWPIPTVRLSPPGFSRSASNAGQKTWATKNPIAGLFFYQCRSCIALVAWVFLRIATSKDRETAPTRALARDYTASDSSLAMS